MTPKVLLVGRRMIVLHEAAAALGISPQEIVTATDLEGVRSALSSSPIPMVFIGAGLDLDLRLAIVRAVFEASGTTSVHLKDAASGPRGFLPFVRAISDALRAPGR